MNPTVLRVVGSADIADSSRTGRCVIAPGGRYVRQAPFHIDTDQAEPATVNALTEYLGAANADHAPIEMHALPDAIVTGQGAVITRNGELLRESVLEFLAFNNVPDGLVAAGDGFGIAEPVTRIIELPSILAKRPWFANFGHWMVDAAALLALAAEFCKTERLMIVLGDVGMGPLRKVMIDTISQILPGSRVVFHPNNESWGFRDLRYVTPVHVPPLFKLPEALSMLREAMLPDWSDIEPSRKIFVVRGTAPHVRALLNSNQIMEYCQRRGYTMVVPEWLSITQTARHFAEARTVVGVKGAALTSALFCRPGAAVMALSPGDFPDPFFWDLVAQRGIHYGEVFGKMLTARTQSHNDFIIEPLRLTHMLDAADAV